LEVRLAWGCARECVECVKCADEAYAYEHAAESVDGVGGLVVLSSEPSPSRAISELDQGGSNLPAIRRVLGARVTAGGGYTSRDLTAFFNARGGSFASSGVPATAAFAALVANGSVPRRVLDDEEAAVELVLDDLTCARFGNCDVISW
jgi:hypothetical protein